MARNAASARMTRAMKRNNDSATDDQGEPKRGRKFGSTVAKGGESTREWMSDSVVAERRDPPWLAGVVRFFYAGLVSRNIIRW